MTTINLGSGQRKVPCIHRMGTCVEGILASSGVKSQVVDRPREYCRADFIDIFGKDEGEGCLIQGGEGEGNSIFILK